MKKVNLIFPFSYLKDPDPGSGSGIRDKRGRIRIRNSGYQKIVGSGSGIGDQHPGSATLNTTGYRYNMEKFCENMCFFSFKSVTGICHTIKI
jgi:hypothetical protein